MKRAASPSSISTKRSKHFDAVEPDILGQVPEQCPTDILEHGVDQAKCIAGKFKMTVPLTGKIEAVVTVHSTTPSGIKGHSFQVFFDLSSSYLAMLDFSPLDEFRLSLKGAELRKVPRVSNTCTLPIQLIFSEHIHISWKKHGPGLEQKVLNTWLIYESRKTDGNSWYHSQAVQPAHFKIRQSEVSKEVIDVASAAASNEPDAPAIVKQLRREKRMEAKRHKREVSKRVAEDTSKARPDATNAEDYQMKHSLSRTSPSLVNHRRPTSRSDSNDENVCTQSPRDALNFEAGFRSGSNVYTALKEVRLGQCAKLIGIVTDMSTPKQTSSGDFMRYIEILDPSNYQESDYGRSRGFKINCFTKRHKEWLPHPELGEVVILRDVKVETYHGAFVGKGYHDRLRWAAFRPSIGEIHHGPANNAPIQEGLGASGLGATFSPFFQPDAPEIAYCIALSDWWRAITERPRDSVTPQQPIQRYHSMHRVHRLISETGPFVPPDGYFDCTVEVLKVYTNSMVHTMYATDYTRNNDMSGAQSNSWSSSLSEYVLKFEMWDDAAQIAREMRPGEYYSIKNARMKINTAGQLEGKVVQDKIVKLDESDAATSIHLKALLERKKNWEAKETSLEPEISYQLIEDVKEGKFFHCTVELLHAVSKPKQLSHIFVTDYTSHPRLAATAVNEAWSAGLEGRVVKILLSEEQNHIAEISAIGSFYAVRKLRLKFSSVEDCFCGTLGGNEKLVIVLNPNKTDNEHLNGLLRRREDWQKNGRQLIKPIPQNLVPAHPKGDRPFTRIKDMPLLNWDIGRYRILARVVDFYPLQLKDAFYQECSLCKKEIPNKQVACFKCGDSDHEYVRYLYQMYIMIEDQGGEQIKISINDKCPLLDGLKRAHLHDDKLTLLQFCKRVDPLVGSLTTMHDKLVSGQTVNLEAVTPLLCFEIDTWVVVPEAIRAFSLNRYEPAPSAS